MILVTGDHSSPSLFIDSYAPDFDGFTDIQIPIDLDRGTMLTDVNRLAFAREIFSGFGRGDTDAQIQKHSFTAPKVLVQGRSRGTRGRERRLAGVFTEIFLQAIPPPRKESTGIALPSMQTTSGVAL